MAWHYRIRNVLAGARSRREIDRELAFHLAERADELEAAGMPHGDAMHHARLQFGNLTSHTERTRDMDIAAWLDTVLRNLRHSARALIKTPAFSITVVLTLALAIGANSAVFSAIQAVLLRPLPFPDGDQLMELNQSSAKNPSTPIAPVRLADWDRLNTTFQAITGYYTEDASELSGELPEKLRRAWVAPRFLQVWGIAPALGRDFASQEEHFGGPNAALISDRLWRRRFAADRNVIGETLRFGTASTTIVGVMPASFFFADRAVDLWSPSPADAPFARNRELTWFAGVGRLKPGVSLAQARANMDAVQASLARQYPKSDATITPSIRPLKEATVGSAGQSLWLLFGSVSLLLLIACTNIAALLFSRAAHRRHEIAVRFSLGASRASVAAQLLSEVGLLAIAGAALGLFLAAGASRLFRMLAAALPRVDEIHLDARIVLYSLACAVAATLLCGLFPALRGTRRGLAGPLASASRGQVSGRTPVQLVLVGVQVALAVTLLAGAGLLVRTLDALGRVSPGFDPAHVFSLQISTSWGETADPKAAHQRTMRILDTLRSVPGVQAAAVAAALPGVATSYQLEIKLAEGRAESEPKVLAESRFVSPDYFATMNIPMLAGETCRNDPAAAQALVNRTFANAFFNGANPIGHHLMTPGNTYIPPSEILGIVGDAREAGLDHAAPPAVYWCYANSQPGTYFLVRTAGAPSAIAETVRRKIREIEPRRSVFDAVPLTDHISDSFAQNRMRAWLLSFFALTAVALACVGLYGTLSYVVSTRRREVGLRLALGALRGQIVTHFLRQGLTVSLIGCAAGLGLALAFTRLLAGMLYGVSPSDAWTLAGVIAIVLSVAILASLLPAIRAARVEPMQVLRDE